MAYVIPVSHVVLVKASVLLALSLWEKASSKSTLLNALTAVSCAGQCPVGAISEG